MDLFALAIAGKDVLLIALLVVIAAGIVDRLYHWDTKIEGRRKNAGKLANVLQEYGADRGADVATCYSVGDYSGFFAGLKSLVEDLLNPEKARVVLGNVFYKALPKLLADNDQRPRILKAVADYAASQATKKE